MASRKEPSQYDLLRGKMNFTNEPLWFRLVLILITAAFFISMAWALKEWVIPALVAKRITGIKVQSLMKLFKSCSP